MRVLIIEDNEIFAKSLKQLLEKEGYSVDLVSDGDAGQRRIELYHKEYDLVILDWMLPEKDGTEVLKNIRAEGIAIPILMLTARDTVEDKVLGLGKGADDYLAKEPFYSEELLARMKALLRRPKEILTPQLHARDLTLDPVSRKSFYSGKELRLTLKEFVLLEYFMRNPNKVLSREQIFSHAWDFASNAMSNVIDVHIHSLRKKICGEKGNKILESVPGVGYRLNSQEAG